VSQRQLTTKLKPVNNRFGYNVYWHQKDARLYCVILILFTSIGFIRFVQN